MKRIRDNVWHITHADLGNVTYKGPVEVRGLGTVNLDIADENYINEYLAKGYAPSFFVAQSAAMGGWFVVVSRQRVA